MDAETLKYLEHRRAMLEQELRLLTGCANAKVEIDVHPNYGQDNHDTVPVAALAAAQLGWQVAYNGGPEGRTLVVEPDAFSNFKIYVWRAPGGRA